MSFYPVYLDLTNKLCVVVGGGNVALRKVKTLLECGGQVRLVSKGVVPGLEEIIKKGEVEYRKKLFSTDDISEAFLVIGATNDHSVNTLVYKTASEEKILVNIVDIPSKCNFIVPSAIRQGDLCISISTGGKSPALAKKMRKSLQKEFGKEYSVFLEIMGRLRPRVIENNPDVKNRTKLFSNVVESDVLELIRKGDKKMAEEKIIHILELEGNI